MALEIADGVEIGSEAADAVVSGVIVVAVDL
jgi:hypothetical protein